MRHRSPTPTETKNTLDPREFPMPRSLQALRFRLSFRHASCFKPSRSRRFGQPCSCGWSHLLGAYILHAPAVTLVTVNTCSLQRVFVHVLRFSHQANPPGSTIVEGVLETACRLLRGRYERALYSDASAPLKSLQELPVGELVHDHR